MSTYQFACKVSKDGIDSHVFEREVSNLYQIQKVKDRHLLQVHKAFKHGSHGIVIMPLAKNSLKAFLNEPTDSDQNIQPNEIQNHPFWSRLLSIAEALGKLHKFSVAESGIDGPIFGYHFDIKPANILIDDFDEFILSDFGQAYFRRVADATSSKVIGMGGTESYAPPEIDFGRVNRKYDVWSLGCVFLEITWYLIMGSSGISKLNKCRRSVSRTRRDDRYFSQDQNGVYSLKKQVREGTDKALDMISAPPARLFMDHIVALIYRMLEPNVDKRLSAENVASDLGQIISRQEEGVLAEFSPDVPETQTMGSVLEIHSIPLSHLRALEYKTNGKWCSELMALRQERQKFRLQYLRDGLLVDKLLGQKSDLYLVPNYAFQPAGRNGITMAILTIQNRSSSTDTVLEEHCFRSRQYKEILHLQCFLLCQRPVGRHWGVDSIQMLLHERKTHPFWRKLFQKQQSREVFREACAVQIWSDRTTQHSSSQDPSLEIDARHLMIFLPNSICKIPFQDGFRIPKEQLRSTNSELVEFVVNDSTNFFASILSSAPNQEWPTIALENTTSSDSPIHVKSMILKLRSKEEAASFRRQYAGERHDWSKQRERYENARYKRSREIGMEKM